jgi:hypothetical protein
MMESKNGMWQFFYCSSWKNIAHFHSYCKAGVDAEVRKLLEQAPSPPIDAAAAGVVQREAWAQGVCHFKF